MDRAAGTLALPFARDALPAPTGRWVFLNAAADETLAVLFADAELVCEQPERPAFLALERAGLAVTPAIEDAPAGRFDGAIVLLGRHRRLNEARIARAARLVCTGAPVLVAGDKTAGAASARKWVKGRLDVSGALSKHHAQLFWFAAEPAAFGDVVLARTEPASGMAAAPGMFSADGIDAGSALLARSIDVRVAGTVADLGAGWGFLSARVLQAGRPSALTLVEAYKPALEAALDNVAPLAGAVPVTGLWHDVTAEPLPGPFDWIVMNPPFHTGRAGEPELGRRFIEAAADALAPRGRLLMVANRQLPYERTLAGRFAEMRVLAEADGYKVIEAGGVRRGAEAGRRRR